MLSADQIGEMLKGLTFAEAAAKLGEFDSYSRSVALAFVLCRSPTPSDTIRVFLGRGNVCDAPWRANAIIADCLRAALREVTLADYLGSTARTFYEALPAVVPVWRGCEKGRERGLHWTTERAIAERFATGQRCMNQVPTIAQALIQKPHIFAVFVDRKESEIVLDPRRLRKVAHEPYCRPDILERAD
jgi:hypothetical protein